MEENTEKSTMTSIANCSLLVALCRIIQVVLLLDLCSTRDYDPIIRDHLSMRNRQRSYYSRIHPIFNDNVWGSMIYMIVFASTTSIIILMDTLLLYKQNGGDEKENSVEYKM